MAIVTVQDIYRCDSCKAASDELGRGCKHGMVTSTGEDYPILKVNDLSDDNAMLEFAVIGLECDILKLSFLGRIKG